MRETNVASQTVQADLSENRAEGGLIENDVITLPSRIPGGNGGSITPIRSSERARELSALRWEKKRRWSEAALVLGVLGPDTPVTEASKCQAYIEATAVQARIANDIDHPLVSQAYRNIRAAIGADIGAPSSKGDSLSNGTGLTITMSDETARAFADTLARVMSG